MAGLGVVLKLEREASLGGSLAKAASGEIEIPPPRPKRKPSHPYPKKASGAFSSSPSFEEDSMSPPAVHSAFTPLESGTRTTVSKMPPKKIGASAASLRLFGQNVVPGSDKVEADTDLMESTGSPRSQISVGTYETSGVSPPVSNAASGVWDQNTSVLKPHEAASALSGTKSELCDAIAEWEKSLIAVHARPEGNCFTSWQPSSFALEGHHLASASIFPAFWQGLAPPSFSHGMEEDVNTAAAIAAATYAVASVWQAIQGAVTNGRNDDSNTSTVYSPIAMLAAARNPISVSRPQSLHAHKHTERERLGNYGSGNGDEGTSLHGEESTAECCSSLTDTSRLSVYESNDEGVPVKKRRRSFQEENMQLNSVALQYLKILKRERISKADGPSFRIEGYSTLDESSHENPHGHVAVHSRSAVDRMDTPSDKAGTERRSVFKLLQAERDLHTAKIVSGNVSMVSDQPIDFIIQACGFDSHLATEKGSSREKEASKGNHELGQEVVSSSTVSQEENKASVPTECTKSSLHREWIDHNRLQIGVNGTCTESGEHLSAGAIMSARYSGAGFVPYKKSIQ